MLVIIYRFIGKWHDLLTAVAASVVLAVAGGILAYYREPVWLNRAGSLIIIIGVILAVARIQEMYVRRIAESFEKNHDAILQEIERKKGVITQAVDAVTSEERLVLSETERVRIEEAVKLKLKNTVRDELIDLLNSITIDRKRVFRFYEIWLVIIGTFLNGFGDFLVCLFKSCGT